MHLCVFLASASVDGDNAEFKEQKEDDDEPFASLIQARRRPLPVASGVGIDESVLWRRRRLGESPANRPMLSPDAHGAARPRRGLFRDLAAARVLRRNHRPPLASLLRDDRGSFVSPLSL